MGGGPRTTRDSTKGAPINPFGALGQADGVEGGQYSYCRRTHRLTVRLVAGGLPAVGGPARLLVARPVQVVVDGELAGYLDERDTIGMLGCLEAGYRLTGQVEAVDPGARTATVVVRGDPAGG